MNERPVSVRRYARQIERALSRISGRPTTVMSPRDWALVTDWHGRGVPVRLVLETLEELAAPRRRPGASRRVRELRRIAPAVEEAWTVVRQGRTGASPAARTHILGLTDARQAWRRAADSLAAASPLRRLLEELDQRLGHGEDPLQLDRDLDRQLAALVPAELLERERREAARALGPYREHMAEETFLATRTRAVVDRLRQDLGLPRLALADPSR